MNSNYQDFKEKANKIIWYLLKNFKEERQKQNQNLDNDEIKMLNEFPKKILQFLEKDLSFLKLDNYFWHVSQKAVDFLWKLNAELKKNEDKRFASTKLDEYPKSLVYKLYLDSFLKEKLFKTSFKMGNINFKIFNNKKTYYQSKDDFFFLFYYLIIKKKWKIIYLELLK